VRVIPQRSEEPVTSTDLREQSLPISGTKSDYAPLRPLVNWIRKINYQEETGDSGEVGRNTETTTTTTTTTMMMAKMVVKLR